MQGKRFAVLGRRYAVDQWCRGAGIARRDVVAGCGPHSFRGMSGPFEVLTLPSFADLPAAWQASILDDIRIAQTVCAR